MKFQPMALQHAPLLHQLYLDTPDYFALLGNRPPSMGEVEHDVQTALFDPRRCLELIYLDEAKPAAGTGAADGEEAAAPIGSLDYKLDFPEPGDVTINLLLIRGELQSGGLGHQVVRLLETRLHGSRSYGARLGRPLHGASPTPTGDSDTRAPRLLASVLGENPRAVAFWQRLGFSFATDARPVMTWYAKDLGAPAPLAPSAVALS
ncbi:GNAT family N-acetyltransferase [Deinococcus altitudinis]|uniref:GNAT family N-acetyltransferase n=1 Tax=Deinococcus altitudinis TaxID=468914 RepID=UPI003891EBD7